MPRAKSIWVTLICLVSILPAACRGRAPTDSPPSDGLSVSYGVDSVRPPSGFALTLPGKGLARVLLQKPWRGDPYGPVGFFAVRPTAETRGELERVVREHSLLDRNEEPGMTAEGSGHLRLTHGRRQAELSLLSKDEGTRELVLLLDGLIGTAKQRPLAAVQVRSKARVDGPNAVVDVVLAQLGTRPLELALHDPKSPGGTLVLRVIFERGGRLADERIISPADIAKLASRGKLPDGWHSMGPASALSIPLPLVRLPPSPEQVSLRVEARVRGRLGQQTADLFLSSAPAELAPEAPAEE